MSFLAGVGLTTIAFIGLAYFRPGSVEDVLMAIGTKFITWFRK